MKENNCNGYEAIIAQAIEEMKSKSGIDLSPEEINLAELERLTGISRGKLRGLKKNKFKMKPHGLSGKKATQTVLTGYAGIINSLLKSGVTNSQVCYERLTKAGYPGGLTTVKNYIAQHKYLVPAKRQLTAPQRSRGVRYTTKPGEAFQMDWGFTKVMDPEGNVFQVACFAMICHYSGQRYVEFFPNAKQENLFIGMLHAFSYMGIPRYVLTDNMKSVVLYRDMDGYPVWNSEYEAFMKAVGFNTRLCKPRHPFTKGKVERLVQHVKQNFLAGRKFLNVTDLNQQAFEWCHVQNTTYHTALSGIPEELHYANFDNNLTQLVMTQDLMFYLCPPRKVSFDGFVTYEGRRFGVPYSYRESVVRVNREDALLTLYSEDLKQILATYEVTWSKYDRFCDDQYAIQGQPEEFPTAPVKTQIEMLPEPEHNLAFDKFNFNKEVD